jgi:hypothetical protein
MSFRTPAGTPIPLVTSRSGNFGNSSRGLPGDLVAGALARDGDHVALEQLELHVGLGERAGDLVELARREASRFLA